MFGLIYKNIKMLLLKYLLLDLFVLIKILMFHCYLFVFSKYYESFY